jgi:hypothetical protein
MSDLPGYDAWKLATPPEQNYRKDRDSEECPDCGRYEWRYTTQNRRDRHDD